VLPDRVDDEPCPLDWCASVSLNIGCAMGDYVALVQLTLLKAGFVVAVDTDEGLGEATTGPKVELNAPIVMAFAEVEGVAVHFPAPLFGCEIAMAVDDDVGLRR
jgi:hypothetical protein